MESNRTVKTVAIRDTMSGQQTTENQSIVNRENAVPAVDLRDYFAAAEKLEDLDETCIFDVAVALAGPKPKGSWSTNTVEWIKWNAKWRAEMRFIRADAMLKAREAKP